MAVNMGYCRWQNTYLELNACAGTLADDPERLSHEELGARRSVLMLAADLLEHLGQDVDRYAMERAIDELDAASAAASAD